MPRRGPRAAAPRVLVRVARTSRTWCLDSPRCSSGTSGFAKRWVREVQNSISVIRLELEAKADEIAELAGRAFIAIGEKVAEKLGVTEGDGLVVTQGKTDISLRVKILSRVAKNCVGFSAGYSETLGLTAGSLVSLVKDQQWVRPTSQMIATDKRTGTQGGSAHV